MWFVAFIGDREVICKIHGSHFPVTASESESILLGKDSIGYAMNTNVLII